MTRRMKKKARDRRLESLSLSTNAVDARKADKDAFVREQIHIRPKPSPPPPRRVRTCDVRDDVDDVNVFPLAQMSPSAKVFSVERWWENPPARASLFLTPPEAFIFLIPPSSASRHLFARKTAEKVKSRHAKRGEGGMGSQTGQKEHLERAKLIRRREREGPDHLSFLICRL